MVVRKRSWPAFFKRILRGDRRIEIRLSDFDDFKKKKFPMILAEWDPKTKKYTGREIKVEARVLSIADLLSLYSVRELKKHKLLVLEYRNPRLVKKGVRG